MEKKDTQLVISNKDVMIKQFVAGFWEGANVFSGFSIDFALPLQGASMEYQGKKRIPAIISEDRHTISFTFPNSIYPGNKYSYILSILPYPALVKKLGNLRILEWPREDLSEIIFLPDTGKTFFSSALGKIKNNNNGSRTIKFSSYASKLLSHMRSASALRLEWGNAPRIQLRIDYKIKNYGVSAVHDIIIKTHLPPNTLFQRINLSELKNPIIEYDNDKNMILTLNVGNIGPNQTINQSLFIDIAPLGNKLIMFPDFGNFKDYFNLTRSGKVGEKLTKSSEFWDFSNPSILNLVKALKKNAKDASEYIQLAFKFVNQKIEYTKDKGDKRYTASETLQSRKGVCSEYSDLFVSLLRAGGIPAKTVRGWILNLDDSNNFSLGPHGWCEYFSPKHGWIQCDPTWGYLIGVSCQHICRKHEGFSSNQPDYSWKFSTRQTIPQKIDLGPENLPDLHLEEKITVEKII
ncbi:MAG: transglutaminase-like domain-containing protein [Promethearchaeota archaeon]